MSDDPRFGRGRDPTDLTEAIEGLVTALGPIFRSLEEVAAAVGPVLAEAGVRMSQTQALIQKWETDAPKVVKDAISSHGLIVPLSQMSLSGLVDLAQTYQDGDDEALRRRILHYYDEIFEAPAFLERLRSSWGEILWLKRRLPLLEQALKAHELALYGATIPTLLAQFEGLV